MFEHKIMDGRFHVHSEYSFLDGVSAISKMVEKYSSLGARCVALTDHGNVIGYYAFEKICKEKSIVPVYGVEAYVSDNETERRKHLILLASDKLGRTGITKFITETNKNIEVTGKLTFPVATKELVNKFFGPESIYHGHVIATSACVGGVVLGLHYQNEDVLKRIDKLSISTKTYTNVIDSIEFIQKSMDEAKGKIKELQEIANTSFRQREKFVKSLEGKEDYDKALEQLNKEKKDAETAKRILTGLKEENKAKQKRISELKKKLPANKDNIKRDIELLEKLKAQVIAKSQIVEKMEEEALFYQNIFGKDNWYLEIQCHGMPEELEYMHHLCRIADKHNMPIVAANDEHMVEKEDFIKRESICSLAFNKFRSFGDSEKEMYIKDDEELYTALVAAVGHIYAEVAVKNLKVLADKLIACYEPEVKEHHYPKFCDDSVAMLRKMCEEKAPVRYGEKWDEKHNQRLQYELSVIEKMGVADYLLIVQDFINFTKKLGNVPEEKIEWLKLHIKELSYEELLKFVDENQTEIGYVVGPGRGSGAGSIVCYITGITNIDPMLYDLLFERFLNPERVSMPDIDTDFANGYRELCIEYVTKKYGKDAVCRIVTKGTTAAKGSIRNMARIMADRDNNEDIVEIGDQLSKKIIPAPHVTIGEFEEDMKPIVEKHAFAKELLNRAKAIEGTAIQHGIHAGGVIISDNDDVSDYVALMQDKTGSWKCQCDMVEAEDRGLLKMDFLGLRNLNIITDTLRLIKKNKGIVVNPDEIKEEEKVITEIFSTARTNSVFQFESQGMKQMLKSFKPTCFNDLVLLVAAYRPGPMEFIPGIVDIKHGRKELTYATPLLQPILNTTYGSIIYQEQVQRIFQSLAGYSLGQADMVRRAMSKKKEAVLLAEREAFINGDASRNIMGCVANGISKEVANELFDSMISFAKYAFNKSHAAAYARVAYITAWLKYHYPAEYLATAMKYVSKIEKIPGLIEECKSFGIVVKSVSINDSEEHVTAKGDTVYLGFSSVKGINSASFIIEERKKGKFTSFADYMLRANMDKTVTENLIHVGAFDEFCENRTSLISMKAAMDLYLKVIKEKTKAMSEKEKIVNILTSKESNAVKLAELSELSNKEVKRLPEVDKTIAKINEYRDKIANAKSEILQMIAPVCADDKMRKFEKEKELLGIYISGHPVNVYNVPADRVKINNLSVGKKQFVYGLVSSVKVIRTKKTGEFMAFLTIEDESGNMEAVCFPKSYAAISDVLEEGKVLKFVCNIAETTKVVKSNDEDGENEEDEVEEVVLQMIIDSAEVLSLKSEDYILKVSSLFQWIEIAPIVSQMCSNNGKYHIILHDGLTGELRPTNLYANEDFPNIMASVM